MKSKVFIVQINFVLKAANLVKMIPPVSTTIALALFVSPVDAPLDAVVHHEEADLGA